MKDTVAIFSWDAASCEADFETLSFQALTEQSGGYEDAEWERAVRLLLHGFVDQSEQEKDPAQLHYWCVLDRDELRSQMLAWRQASQIDPATDAGFRLPGEGNPALEPAVPAKAHPDDWAFEVEFDATAYFAWADDKTIAEIVACGYGGDYPSDYVASFFSDTNMEIARMFDYCHTANLGFECYVDPAALNAWIRKHRPALAAQLEIE